jgi:hypothetical protein
MQTLWSSPGLEDVWQLHWAYAAGMELNTPGLFIANIEDTKTLADVLQNPPPTFGQAGARGPGGPGAPGAPGGRGAGGGRGMAGGHTGPAFYIKVAAESDGTFTVTNTRNGFSKTYTAKK